MSEGNGTARLRPVRRTSDASQPIRPDRTMNVREFLRGGYGRDRGGITVVMNAGTVEGIWLHGGDALRVALPGEPEQKPGKE